MPVVEAAGFLTAGLVERHQPVDVGLIDRPAERAAREVGAISLGARALLARPIPVRRRTSSRGSRRERPVDSNGPTTSMPPIIARHAHRPVKLKPRTARSREISSSLAMPARAR
jgi:hypothetical protein